MKKIILVILPCAHLLAAQVEQQVTAFGFFLQNCFVGIAQEACQNPAIARYQPPLIKQSNFTSHGDRVIQEASLLQIVAQNCACITGDNCCNGTLQARTSAGPITQKVIDAGGSPVDLNLQALTPTQLTPSAAQQTIQLPLGTNVHDPRTNVSYYALTPTQGPLRGKKIEILLQNLTAFTK